MPMKLILFEASYFTVKMFGIWEAAMKLGVTIA